MVSIDVCLCANFFSAFFLCCFCCCCCSFHFISIATNESNFSFIIRLQMPERNAHCSLWMRKKKHKNLLGKGEIKDIVLFVRATVTARTRELNEKSRSKKKSIVSHQNVLMKFFFFFSFSLKEKQKIIMFEAFLLILQSSVELCCVPKMKFAVKIKEGKAPFVT